MSMAHKPKIYAQRNKLKMFFCMKITKTFLIEETTAYVSAAVDL
jgi:hypothetical protein